MFAPAVVLLCSKTFKCPSSSSSASVVRRICCGQLTEPFLSSAVARKCRNNNAAINNGAPNAVLSLQAPVKILGDIHGQFSDLLRLFSEFGAPTEEGDLMLTDYLFLGDFVDRGYHQLEVVCLVLALKAGSHPMKNCVSQEARGCFAREMPLLLPVPVGGVSRQYFYFAWKS